MSREGRAPRAPPCHAMMITLYEAAPRRASARAHALRRFALQRVRRATRACALYTRYRQPALARPLPRHIAQRCARVRYARKALRARCAVRVYKPAHAQYHYYAAAARGVTSIHTARAMRRHAEIARAAAAAMMRRFSGAATIARKKAPLYDSGGAARAQREKRERRRRSARYASTPGHAPRAAPRAAHAAMYAPSRRKRYFALRCQPCVRSASRCYATMIQRHAHY